MAQERLSNDEFLSRLSSLLSTTHSTSHGSVFLTQKTLPTTTDSSEPAQILIRATNGLSKKHRVEEKTKIKLATVVDVADLEAFYTKYADVCRKGMEGLRKRDKKKAKEKAKAKKKGKKGTGAAGTGTT